jgi:glycosyltransferase involved in cell wall biosynthesis
MNARVDFTIAIPTYNGEKRLPDVLEKLRSQIDVEHISWEIIVIDNNSNDNTAEVVREYQATWPQSYPLKYSFEPQQGAAFARARALKEAKSELIGFLDDDNLPESDWITQAYAFALEHPNAGAYGSRIFGEFEATPPDNFDKIAPFLALTDRGSLPRLYPQEKKVLPPSAGLVVRKRAWLDNVPHPPILSGRIPGSMLTGEDLEAIAHIQQAGWEIWYNPAMLVYHKIPHHRLERNYLIPFFRGIGRSRYVTRMLSVKPQHKPMALLAYIGNDLRKIVLHLLKYRTKVRTDLIAACEMELYLNSLYSPFYLWRKGLLSAKPMQSASENSQPNPETVPPSTEKFKSAVESLKAIALHRVI